jgi:hypothetical protein
MCNNNIRRFKRNGTLGQPNNNNNDLGLREERLKTKNKKGEEIEISRIKRSRANLSSFTKRGLENSSRIKILNLPKLSQSEILHLLYSDDPESDELRCMFKEERNKSIQKIYEKCENRFGNIDYKKYRLYHHELDEYAIPLKDIEEIQPKPTQNEITEYQYSNGFVSQW